MRHIRRIEIRSRKLVQEIFAGQYLSVFKGRGMEFSEVREYIPGDDYRLIDHNVSARYGRPFVKKFSEERELTVIFVVDMSGSLRFGSQDKFKSELAAELTSVLAFSAIKNNDRVGMLIFTDRVEKIIPPRKGQNHILRLIREILYFQPEHSGTDLGVALTTLNELWRRRAVVFLLSDFYSQKDFSAALKVTSRRHDLIAITLLDRRESNLPGAKLLRLRDRESGEIRLLDTTDELWQENFRRKYQQWQGNLLQLFRRCRIDNIQISSEQPYARALWEFFRRREKRQAHWVKV